ncbi:MAG: peptide chain release factor N(5)-glutamine methyltransferase [Candidatus Eisenbacteria bacterium]|uniref:Release factor glutamine methyltransferase n=1 Tax=Eiseniibacteriota bacterium TaxID=2212470 RepID=A0A7Y2H1Q5_UNCEI|nr:peptide chain release factor N(5)-glutamine methyltransferase [Candidatus Eisenbacteria bacterium]
MPHVPLEQADTVAQWRAAARSLLRDAGFENPNLEADYLLRHVLDYNTTQILTQGEHPLSPGNRSLLASLVQKRLNHVPLQHLTGEVEFRGLRLSVSPSVLIPRPETEGLVDHVLKFLDPSQESKVLDIGTGSGCIALAVAQESPQTQIWASDVSQDALNVASANADQCALSDRVRFKKADTILPLLKRKVVPAGSVDVIVSNPPYIGYQEKDALPVEVKDHEPGLALFANDEGLEMIRSLIHEAPYALRKGGFLAMEIGETQGERVLQLLQQASNASWSRPRIENDLAGRPRYALAILSSDPIPFDVGKEE